MARDPRRRLTWREETPFWRRLLWALVFPTRSQKVSATVPGVVLIVLAVGLGVAAYNSASNILFVTLSLLLGCLILSGVLSWLNFRKLRWSLEVEAPMRAGREHPAAVRVENGKRLLPVYGLAFEVSSTSAPASRELVQRHRLDPGAGAVFPWLVKPARRGVERVELLYVGSLFPFGFLRKSLAARTASDVTVWPAPVEYRRWPVAAWRRAGAGAPVGRLGQSGDLVALRDYRHGDSHRQVHWKASARQGRLVVRQFSADSEDSFTVRVEADAGVWSEGEQFERLCRLAATLAEDLFRAGRLRAVAFGREPASAVRGVRDLEVFLDRLALLRPEPGQAAPGAGRSEFRFGPDGTKGVSAYVDGEKAAAA